MHQLLLLLLLMNAKKCASEKDGGGAAVSAAAAPPNVFPFSISGYPSHSASDVAPLLRVVALPLFRADVTPVMVCKRVIRVLSNDAKVQQVQGA
jgi:hypothetical protein